ncbi:MarR family winged helix-turn-helix transcriptional regulator [Amycolatopsis vancoresmycina]|uniref:MarR family transcriptional regulator n=1 Tax=Amycolatopsis vancoresmycina DSM 44592 TaxID=1292037 RepID=R1I785_9PSEU|nr:MarR family transcriptional regulator [Amycolatopsis vancoresmycina]EOD66304.1 MarR family transcriptional regulator [Amycolatopsis vancoresmycina DSM 44592]
MGDTETGELRSVLPRILQLGTLMNRSGLGERAMRQIGADLDRPGLSILVSLHMTGKALRVGEIAERMQVAGPHVTRHLHVLERRRLVRGLADPDDRRARLVELTPEGAEIADRYFTTLLGWFGDALSGWAPEDRRTFYDLLLRFTDDFAAYLSATSEE